MSDESKLDKDDGDGQIKTESEIKDELKKDEKKEDTPTHEDKKLLDGKLILYCLLKSYV